MVALVYPSVCVVYFGMQVTKALVKLKSQGALTQIEDKNWWGRYIAVTVLDPLRHYISSDLVGNNISSIVYLTAAV